MAKSSATISSQLPQKKKPDMSSNSGNSSSDSSVKILLVINVDSPHETEKADSTAGDASEEEVTGKKEKAKLGESIIVQYMYNLYLPNGRETCPKLDITSLCLLQANALCYKSRGPPMPQVCMCSIYLQSTIKDCQAIPRQSQLKLYW